MPNKLTVMSSVLISSCLFCDCFRAECESYVKGFPGARYKKFSTEYEAETFVSGSGFSGSSTVSAPYVRFTLHDD